MSVVADQVLEEESGVAPDDETPPSQTIFIPLSAMGVFIGRECENLKAMRAWPGIMTVIVSAALESTDEPKGVIIMLGESQEAVDRLANYLEVQAPLFARLADRYCKLENSGRRAGGTTMNNNSGPVSTTFVVPKRATGTIFSDKGGRFRAMAKKEDPGNLLSMKEICTCVGTPGTSQIMLKGNSRISVARAERAFMTLAEYFPRFTGCFFASSKCGAPVLSITVRVLPPVKNNDDKTYLYYQASHEFTQVPKYLHPELTVAPAWSEELYSECVEEGLKKGLSWSQVDGKLKVCALAGKTFFHSRALFSMDSVNMPPGSHSLDLTLFQVYQLLSERGLRHFQTSNRNSPEVMTKLGSHLAESGYTRVEKPTQARIQLHFVEVNTQRNYEVTLVPSGAGKEVREGEGSTSGIPPTDVGNRMTVAKFKPHHRRFASLNFLREGKGADFVLNVESKEEQIVIANRAARTWIEEEWRAHLKDNDVYDFHRPRPSEHVNFQMLAVRHIKVRETISNDKFKVGISRVLEVRSHPPMLAGLHGHGPVWEVQIQSLGLKKYLEGPRARDVNAIMMYVRELVQAAAEITAAMGTLAIADTDPLHFENGL